MRLSPVVPPNAWKTETWIREAKELCARAAKEACPAVALAKAEGSALIMRGRRTLWRKKSLLRGFREKKKE